MQDLEMKKKVAQEIMDLMDQKDGDRLKNHPKFMAASIEVEKPKEMCAECEKSPCECEKSQMEEPKEEGEEISPEILQKLMEMLDKK